MISAYDLLDLIGHPDEHNINSFCTRNNFGHDIFMKALHTGDQDSIDQLARALMKDILDKGGLIPQNFIKIH